MTRRFGCLAHGRKVVMQVVDSKVKGAHLSSAHIVHKYKQVHVLNMEVHLLPISRCSQSTFNRTRSSGHISGGRALIQ